MVLTHQCHRWMDGRIHRRHCKTYCSIAHRPVKRRQNRLPASWILSILPIMWAKNTNTLSAKKLIMTHHDNAPRTRGMTAKLSNWWLTDKYTVVYEWLERKNRRVSVSCQNTPSFIFVSERTYFYSRGRPTSTSFEVGHSKQCIPWMYQPN